MRLLLIEDSPRLQRSLGDGLRQAGYAVDIVGDGREGLGWAQAGDYDLIILDLMLPGLDGLAVLRKLRQAGRETHVLVLTAKDTVEDRVRGLQTGADDYLVKPFAFDELLARVQALLRRRHGVKNPLIRIRHLEIDTSARTVVVLGDAVSLAPREYALLEYLARRKGAVVSRAEIERHIYDGTAELMSNAVDSAICALRKKIDVPGEPSLVQTRRGAGLRSPGGSNMISIQRKLTVGLLLGLSALLAVSGTILYIYMNAVLGRQFDVALAAEADAICSHVKMQHNGKIEIENPQDPVLEPTAGARYAYYQISREDGTILLRSPALGTYELAHPVVADAPVFTNIELPQRRPGRAIAVHFVVPIAEDDDEHEGAINSTPQRADKKVIVAVAQDRSELNRTMAVLLWALLGIAMFMAVGIVVVVSIEVWRGLSPLQAVAAAVGKIDAQSLDFRFSLDSIPSELQPICLRLNDSLERLQTAFERERRFTANVAHELRTPIAELRTLADVAIKWDGDRKTSIGYFKDTHDISQQMEKIVTALLSLARCQSGTATTVRESVDLSALVHAAWDERRQEVAERRLDVTLDMPDRLMLTIDRTMLSSIVTNLINNAAQYARTGGMVACKVNMNGSEVLFSVTNDMDNLSPEDLPHLFEPFWRKDIARTDGTHCGLGLTLVGAYAAVLGGKIDASLPGKCSICVALMLPCGCLPENP